MSFYGHLISFRIEFIQIGCEASYALPVFCHFHLMHFDKLLFGSFRLPAPKVALPPFCPHNLSATRELKALRSRLMGLEFKFLVFLPLSSFSTLSFSFCHKNSSRLFL
jgi:hypothetical protein